MDKINCMSQMCQLSISWKLQLCWQDYSAVRANWTTFLGGRRGGGVIKEANYAPNPPLPHIEVQRQKSFLWQTYCAKTLDPVNAKLWKSCLFLKQHAYLRIRWYLQTSPWFNWNSNCSHSFSQSSTGKRVIVVEPVTWAIQILSKVPRA